jgi:hypothetical protein
MMGNKLPKVKDIVSVFHKQFKVRAVGEVVDIKGKMIMVKDQRDQLVWFSLNNPQTEIKVLQEV